MTDAPTQSPTLSIVIPVYNEKDSVAPLVQELLDCPVADRIGEILFVDDGSDDGTTTAIEAMCAAHEQVKAIVFRRNFGKSAALDAGFRHAQGDIVLTMDGDLQDDPAEIPQLIAKLDDGFDMVSGWKQHRQDPVDKTLPSRLFNAVTRRVSGVDLQDFNCGLKAYRREVVRELNLYGELHRFIPVLAHCRGFRIGEVPVNHRPRRHGKSKFGSARLINGFLDFITVTYLSRYNRRPMRLFGLLGTSVFALGGALNAFLVIRRMIMPSAWLTNSPYFFLGILLMILGFQLLSAGLVGEMLVHMRPGHAHYSVARRVKVESCIDEDD